MKLLITALLYLPESLRYEVGNKPVFFKNEFEREFEEVDLLSLMNRREIEVAGVTLSQSGDISNDGKVTFEGNLKNLDLQSQALLKANGWQKTDFRPRPWFQ